jgi:hypothetical protein
MRLDVAKRDAQIGVRVLAMAQHARAALRLAEKDVERCVVAIVADDAIAPKNLGGNDRAKLLARHRRVRANRDYQRDHAVGNVNLCEFLQERRQQNVQRHGTRLIVDRNRDRLGAREIGEAHTAYRIVECIKHRAH